MKSIGENASPCQQYLQDVPTFLCDLRAAGGWGTTNIGRKHTRCSMPRNWGGRWGLPVGSWAAAGPNIAHCPAAPRRAPPSPPSGRSCSACMGQNHSRTTAHSQPGGLWSTPMVGGVGLGMTWSSVAMIYDPSGFDVGRFSECQCHLGVWASCCFFLFWAKNGMIRPGKLTEDDGVLGRSNSGVKKQCHAARAFF